MKATYVTHSGSDLMVVNAARVSFSKTSEWEYVYGGSDEYGDYEEPVLSDKDTKLVKYLASHKHFSPFNHCFITLHVKAPIFVARQLQKHEYMPWSEISRRYVDLEPEFYRPETFRLQSPDKKQGSYEDRFVKPDETKRYCPVCGNRLEGKADKRFCSSKCQAKNYRSTPEGWQVGKLARLKISAEKRGLEFNLTEIPTPKFCVYLGIELDYESDGYKPNTPSVDRIDNSKGYLPDNIQVISSKANTMKGGASDEELVKFAKSVLAMHGGYFCPESDSIDQYYSRMKTLYKELIEDGMSREEARGFMPQSMMTEWYWSGTLKAWAKMYNLRTKPDAQWETQQIALQCGEIIAPLFPYAWAALKESDL